MSCAQFPGSVLKGKGRFPCANIPHFPPVLLTMLCSCSGGLLWGGAGAGMGAGGAGAGGPALASDPSEMEDSSGSGPPGTPCRWKRRLMICWYCFLWVGGRATAGLCSIEPLRLRGRGISASTRATSSSSGTDCASGGRAGCSRVGLRGRVTVPSSTSPASSTGASSPSSSGSGSSSAGALGVPRRNERQIRGGALRRPHPQDSLPTTFTTWEQHLICCVTSGQFLALSGLHFPWAGTNIQ